MKKGLTRLLALLVALLLILGTAAGCGKKKSTTDTSGDTSTVDQSVADDNSSDASTSVDESTDNSTDVTDQTTSDSSTAANDDTSSDKTSGNSGKSNSTGGSKTTTKTGTTSTNKITPIGKVDLKGYTIKVACWWNLDPKTPGNTYFQKAVDREKQVKAKYNVKFSWVNVPGQGLKDKLTSSVLAGDPVADIARCRSGWVLPTLAGKKIVEPADKYFDVSDPLWNPYVTKQAMYKGHPMGVMNTGLSSWTAMVYNRSMIQKAGLADPQTLVASKQWTWAKFEQYAKTLTKDTNGDGKNEQFGTTGPSWQQAIASNGGKIVSEVNGVDKYTLNSAQAIEALKWVQKIDKENIAGGDMTAFAAGNVGFAWWASYDTGFKSTMKDKWGVVPTPLGPKGKDYAAWYDEVHLYTIPANSKHPREAAAIWTDYNEWLPGTNREIVLRDAFENTYAQKQDVDMAVFISTKFWLDKYFAYNDVMNELWTSDGNDIDSVVAGTASKSIDQWSTEKAPKMQSVIDQLWAQFK